MAKLGYKMRVMCEEFYYGSDCNVYCKPRDDVFGHYDCDHLGQKRCYSGWKGNNCDQGKFHHDCYHLGQKRCFSGRAAIATKVSFNETLIN